LRLLPVERPALRPRAAPSRLLPLDALRAEFQTGGVQVIFLAASRLPMTSVTCMLPAEEQARAQRLLAPAVRRGFVAGRWLVRSVLAALTGVEPQSLALRVGKHGKLFLTGHERIAPSFNLSHSGDLVALALVRERRVGIDIEAERPLTDETLLARRILGPRERERFDTLPEAARASALLVAWTRKEAVLKAAGTGVSGSLRSIEVMLPDAIAASGDAAVVHSADPPARWSVRALSMPPGFQGALAVEGEPRRPVIWQAVPTQR
jgi:4'-phosphopantetheinyl transferase